MEHICTKCREVTSILSDFEYETFGCPSCSAVFEWDNNAWNFRKILEYKPKDILLPIGKKGIFDGETFEVVGMLIKKVHSIFYWREYTLMSPKGTLKYLSEADGHWILLEAVPEEYDVSRTTLTLEHKDIKYKLFEYITCSNAKVFGFFDFKTLRESHRIAEFINPPLLISIEGPDDTTFLGKHISSKELKKAFQLNALPTKSGVGLVQPFLLNLYNTLLIFLGVAIAILLTFLIINSNRTQKEILNTSLNFDEYKTNSYNSPSFELKGSPAPLVIEANTGVDNSWANASISLVNEKTNEEEIAQKDIEMYHGYTDGENWSEGSQSVKFQFCGVAQGNYHLVISPSKQETDTLNQNMSFTVIWNQSSYWNFMFSIVTLAGIMLLIYFIKNIFEQRRWGESDFSPANKHN